MESDRQREDAVEEARLPRPCCLTVAGSDSGGNAGVQADLRAFHAYGIHGCTVFAALTAQNPFGVSAVHAVPADFVAAQLDAVLGTYALRGMKTGMLADPAAIDATADRLREHPEIAKVIDPVMVATSGARLVSPAAMRAILDRLLPLATVVTPNLPEARVLAGRDPFDVDTAAWADAARGGTEADARSLAEILARRYGCAVLVKGGHGAGGTSVDVLYDPHAAGDPVSVYTLPRVEHPLSTHGTGCSLAAALAAELALGHALPEAVRGAKGYVYEAIRSAYRVGPACGVLGFVSPVK